MKIYKNHNLISFKGKAMAYILIKKNCEEKDNWIIRQGSLRGKKKKNDYDQQSRILILIISTLMPGFIHMGSHLCEHMHTH